MSRHKTEYAETIQVPLEEYDELKEQNVLLRELVKWIGAHIHVRNANGQRTAAKCALCPFTYRKDERGRSVKDACRHGEIWGIK